MIPRLRYPNVKSRAFSKQIVFDFSGGLNTASQDILLGENELSGGQNMTFDTSNTLAKRSGRTLHSNTLGVTTGVLGLFNFTNNSGTSVMLAVYDTGVYTVTSGSSTLLSSVTMTTNLPANGAYFPATNKFYIGNGTDNVVKYTSGTSGDQTDASFKKGKYMVHFQNRLLVADASTPNKFWYTDLGVDTFSSNNYVTLEEPITGMVGLLDKVLIFTEKRIYRLQNFTFSGTASGPEALIPLPTAKGTVAHRSIVVIDNNVYYVARDENFTFRVYVTNGFTVQDISQKILDPSGTYSSSQLSNCAAIAYGTKYYLSIATTASGTNDTILIYDTAKGRWFTPYKGWGVSCFAIQNISSQATLFGGSVTNGRVYKLETGDYDEGAGASYTTGTDTNNDIDGLSAKRAAQSFTLTDDFYVTGVAVLLKKSSGTTTGLTVRIETDSAGVPSGTLAHANATGTIGAFTDTSYIWKDVRYTAFQLTASTTYWLVVQHTTEGSGNSVYHMASDNSSPTYSSGNLATYASSTWTAAAGADALFMVYTQGDIDGYADTKAFALSSPDLDKRLKWAYILTTSQTTNYNMQFGISTTLYGTFLEYDVSLMGNSQTTWGGGSTWGGGAKWGSPDRVKQFKWVAASATRGKYFKFRFRNRYANEPFRVIGITINYITIPKLR